MLLVALYLQLKLQDLILNQIVILFEFEELVSEMADFDHHLFQFTLSVCFQQLRNSIRNPFKLEEWASEMV